MFEIVDGSVAKAIIFYQFIRTDVPAFHGFLQGCITDFHI